LRLAGQLAADALSEPCPDLAPDVVAAPRGCRAVVAGWLGWLGTEYGHVVDLFAVPAVLWVAIRAELRRPRPADFVPWLIAVDDTAPVPIARLADEVRDDRSRGCLTGRARTSSAFVRHLRHRHPDTAARWLYRLAVALAAHRCTNHEGDTRHDY
jgi:hypothetical protein